MTGRMRLGLVVGAAVVLLAAATLMRNRALTARAPAAVPVGVAQATTAGGVPVDDVRLERLGQTALEPAEVERNLFRFRPAPSQTFDPRATTPRAPAPAPQMPAASVQPPQQIIPLRYIGLLEAPSQAGRVGVLSDGRGNVFYGREGDIIEGRYLLREVGPASVELSYLDGRGRQTIRLSGQ